jgi:hypothetical protein
MRAHPEWFDFYAAAFLEADLDQVNERVERARKAIIERIASLEAGECAINREPHHLKDALLKLQILVNVASEMNRPLHFPPNTVPQEQGRTHFGSTQRLA